MMQMVPCCSPQPTFSSSLSNNFDFDLDLPALRLSGLARVPAARAQHPPGREELRLRELQSQTATGALAHQHPLPARGEHPLAHDVLAHGPPSEAGSQPTRPNEAGARAALLRPPGLSNLTAALLPAHDLSASETPLHRLDEDDLLHHICLQPAGVPG